MRLASDLGEVGDVRRQVMVAVVAVVVKELPLVNVEVVGESRMDHGGVWF